MELGWKVLVLLAFGIQLASCAGIVCKENKYKNDERLITVRRLKIIFEI